MIQYWYEELEKHHSISLDVLDSQSDLVAVLLLPWEGRGAKPAVPRPPLSVRRTLGMGQGIPPKHSPFTAQRATIQP